MKLEQQLLTNREWSWNNNYWSPENEVRTATIDQEGMKLEQQLLINGEWISKNNYCPIGNEVGTTTTDQHGMKFEQKGMKEWT